MADSRHTKSIGLPPIKLLEKSVSIGSKECQRCAGYRSTLLKNHWRLIVIALILVGTGVFVALVKLYATDDFTDDLAEYDILRNFNALDFSLTKQDDTEFHVIQSKQYASTSNSRSKRNVLYKKERLKKLARKDTRLKRSLQNADNTSSVSESKDDHDIDTDLLKEFKEMSHLASLPQNISNDEYHTSVLHESSMGFNKTLYKHYKPICSDLSSFMAFCHTLRLNLARHNRTKKRSSKIPCDKICQECKDGTKLDEQTRKKRCRYKHNPVNLDDYPEYRSASEIHPIYKKVDDISDQDNTLLKPVDKSEKHVAHSDTDAWRKALCSTDLEAFCIAVNQYVNLTESRKNANIEERSDDVQISTDKTNNERDVIFTSTTASGDENIDEDEELNEQNVKNNIKQPSEVVDNDAFAVNSTSLPEGREIHDLTTNKPDTREGEDISSERIVVPTHSTDAPKISKMSSQILPNAPTFATPMCFFGPQVPVLRNDQPGGIAFPFTSPEVTLINNAGISPRTNEQFSGYGNFYGAPMPGPQNMMGYGYNYPGNAGYLPQYPIRPQIPSFPSHLDQYFGGGHQYPGYGAPYGFPAMPQPPLPTVPAPVTCPPAMPRADSPAVPGAHPGVNIAINYRDAEEQACRPGLRRCDTGGCVADRAWCDGEVHCADASDESNCGCAARLDQSKICDGYFDCPKGEDEMGCFGCRHTSFSCNDWTEKSPKTTCFETVQRCNFIPDCPNGRDEADCNLLTDHFDDHPVFAISHTKGFLHRNFGGTWYPVCQNPYQWAQQACSQENGQLLSAPYIQMAHVEHNQKEQFLNHIAANYVQMSTKCYNNSAMYVTCPNMLCGTRIPSISQNLHHKTDVLRSRIKRKSGHFLNLIIDQMRNEAIMAHVRPIIDKNPDAYGYLFPPPTAQLKYGYNLPEVSPDGRQFYYNNMEQLKTGIYSQTPTGPFYENYKPMAHQNGVNYVPERQPVHTGIPHYHKNPNYHNYQETGSSQRADIEILDQKRGKRGEGRVVGGKPSAPADWPWVVAMYRDGSFHCGGTIISELWILSAAHCVDKYWKHFYEIQAGVLRRLSFSPQEQSRTVTHVIVNQYYDRSDMRNDLSLLRMINRLNFNRWVRPACLPSPRTAGSTWLWGPSAGTVCTAVGWGALQEHGPDPDHMHEVEVPIALCKHREDRAGKEICAGEREGGKDACQGDSGGPLLCRSPSHPEDSWYLAGIVSHGEGCARRNEPGAYTRVSLFVEWIEQYMFLDETLLPPRQPLHECPGFSCTSGIARCLPKKRLCDKIIDCLNSEDEINCLNFRKSEDESMEMNERSSNHSREKEVNTTTAILSQSSSASSNEILLTTAKTTGTTSSSSNESKENATFDKTSSSSPESNEMEDKHITTGEKWSTSSESEEKVTKSTTSTKSSLLSSESKETDTKITSTTVNTWAWNNESKEMPAETSTETNHITNMRQPSKDISNFISQRMNASDESSFLTTLSPVIPKPFDTSKNVFNENESNTLTTTMVPEKNGIHQDEDGTEIEVAFKKLNKKISAVVSEGNFTVPFKQNYTHDANSMDNHIVEENALSKNNTEGRILNNTSLNSDKSFNVIQHSIENNNSSQFLNNMEPKHIVVNSGTNNATTSDMSNLVEVSPDKVIVIDSKHTKELHPDISNNSQEKTKKIEINTHGIDIERPATTVSTHKQILIPAQLHRSEEHPIVFQCRSMKQIIPFEFRCNNRMDCEDGTDEYGCNCLDYMMALHPALRCDGYIDCADGIDEVNCDICPPEYFLCKASRMCLPNIQVCDGVQHCQLAEDEADCFALTNGKDMNFDLYGRPNIQLSGLLTKKVSKWWEVVCDTQLRDEEYQETTAENICNYLGFSGYDQLDVKKIEMEDFNTRFSHENHSLNVIVRPHSYMKTKECTALHVRCYPTINTNIEAHRLFTAPDKTSNVDSIVKQLDFRGIGEFEWPWIAKIYMEGIYKCSGILTDDWWVIINEKCLPDSMNEHYVTAVLGRDAWTQVLSVDTKLSVSQSSVSMLRLRHFANVTRHVRPMPLPYSYLKDINSEVCIAVGRDTYNRTATVFLKEIDNDCGTRNRCFIRHPKHHSTICLDGKYSGIPWNGIITCRNKHGWFPAAVFEEPHGDCGFQGQTIAPSLAHLRSDIMTITFGWSGPAHPMPECAGSRCLRGACVPWSRVCDGVPDCADGGDELKETCMAKREFCKHKHFRNQCGCEPDQLRCINEQCVAKSAFSDGTMDCEDGSDEPIALSGRGAELAVPCASYLSMVAPKRLCDGNLHCYDRSDEDPGLCKCFDEQNLKCHYSGRETCVSPDVVCDGQWDCPYGEDEAMCIGLRNLNGMSNAQGEVMVRSHGIWHTKCFDQEEHTRTELESICRQMGFLSGHAIALSVPAPLRNLAGRNIGFQLANFSNVILNNRTSMYFRNSVEPFAKPVVANGSEECHALYIECR